jgi:thiamine biosynthesis lipoprotein
VDKVERTFSVMHSDALIVLYPAAVHSEADVRTAVARAESRSREIERTFTRFDRSSELCMLNRACGRWVDVSPDLAEVLALSRDLHAETGGVFDPSILPDLERVGYDRTFEDLADERESDPTAGSLEHTFDELEVRGRTARLPVGVRIDLGGIVKGWAADELADELYEIGPVLVELGGDIAIRGKPPTSEEWQVAVQSGSGDLLAILEVDRGAVATSSTEKIRWRLNGRWSHHLIDPITREPARSDLRQVTALGDRAASTEVWAKTALILGAEGSARLVADRPGLELLLLPVAGAPVASAGMIAAASALRNRA